MPNGGSTELLERGAVLLELSRLLGEAEEGRGRLAFVGGEAGIGKTSLVRRFGELVDERTPVLVGGCDPLSTPRPLAPLLDVADRLPGAPVSLEEGKDRIFRDVLAALASSQRPLVLVFEDVHWADETTLDLLRFLARRIAEHPALLIATFRDDEAGDRHPLRLVLGDVATAPAVRRLSLAPLSPGAVRALAAGSGLDPAELFQRTGGNPFFVTEILGAGGEWIPGTVRDAVLARAARLSTPARGVLDAAAVIGFRSEPWLLDQVAESEEGALDACLASGMLVAREGLFTFRHELARDAVLGVISPQRRRALHRRVLELLRAAPPSEQESARLAAHAEEAGEREGVLEFAPTAALQAAALGAHREAAAQYARALRFADALAPAQRADLLASHARESSIVDQHEESIASSRELVGIARGLGDRPREGSALAYLASCLVTVGRNEEAEEASRASLAILESLPAGRELAEGLAVQARLRMLNRDCAEAVEYAERALEVAVPGGHLIAELNARNSLGAALLLMGDERGRSVLEEAIEGSHAAGNHVYTALAYGNLGSIAGEFHEFERACDYFVRGMAYAAEYDIVGTGTYMRSWYALSLVYLGRWEEAESTARELLARPSVTGISRIMATLALGKLLTRRGEPEGAAVVDAALELALPTGTLQRVGPVRIARAEAAWLKGDLERVRDEASAALELALAKRHVWISGELLYWLRRTGEEVEAPEWIATPFALQLQGRWGEAADEWRRRRCPYEAAQALAETGSLEDLRSAHDELERLGARPATQRALQRLRASGVRGIPRGPRPSTRASAGGLTRRETEIARLLGEGLRNSDIAARLFLSPKTVDHHVSRILGKLGVRTRGEAARAAERLGLLEDPVS